MPLVNVAIVAVDGFSPFHYSVPCILFGDTVSGEKRFNVTICAEKPGFLTSKDGFALHATQDFLQSHRLKLWLYPTGSTCWSARLRRCSTAGSGQRQRGGNCWAVSGIVCTGLCGHTQRQTGRHPLGV